MAGDAQHPEDTPLSSPLPGDLTSGVPIPSGRVSVRDRDRTRSRDRRLARSRSRERLESDFGVSAPSTANTAYAEGLNDSELVDTPTLKYALIELDHESTLMRFERNVTNK